MANQKSTDTVYGLAQPIAEKNGLSIYEVEYKKEGSDYVLRVILDTTDDSSDSFVSLNACESVSRELSELLDEKDPVSGAYMLEVTSPGLDRPLKKPADFVRFVGRTVDVGLYKSVNGSKTLCGTLKGLEDGILTLRCGDETVSINYSDTAFVKLAVIF